MPQYMISVIENYVKTTGFWGTFDLFMSDDTGVAARDVFELDAVGTLANCSEQKKKCVNI